MKSSTFFVLLQCGFTWQHNVLAVAITDVFVYTPSDPAPLPLLLCY